MKPPPFDMARPRGLAEVFDLLSSGADAKLIAGGQSLVPLMSLRMSTPGLLIDLNRVEGLAGISLTGGELRIGAMTRHKDLLGHPLIESAAPLIAAALPHVGHVQTRNRGTIGGSLAHADPAAELPLVIATLNATVIAQSRRGSREIRGNAFFADALTTALAPDELITDIRLRAAPQGTRVAFHEYSRRHGDFAIAAAAVQLCRSEAGYELRAGLGGVGPTPHVCHGLAAAFAAGGITEDRIAALVEQEIALLQPPTDLQATGDYRRHLARLALTDCLRKVMP
jgi:CO/xanthine dehydrogenase FAD-binding subunit